MPFDDPVECYRIYGLRLRSPLPFTELPVEAGDEQRPADVVLELGPIGVERPADVDAPSWYRASPTDVALHWHEFGSARVRDGRTIRLDVREEVDPVWARAVVLGTLFSVLLQQRGLFPLHAGAVRIGGGARAFVGASGAGKSSLAGALAARGHALLSDDVLPLERGPDGPPRAHPGRGWIKLDPDAAEALGQGAGALAPLAREEEGKGALVEGFTLAAEPCPLAAVYQLAWDEGTALTPLSAQETFRLFLENAHGGELLVAAHGREGAMRWCAELAQGTRAFRLARPREWGALERAVRAIEDHDPER